MASLNLNQVESTLDRLWRERSVPTGVRATTVNLVSVCASAADAARSREIFARLIQVHPGRALVVCLHGEGPAAMTAAQVGLVETPGGPTELTGDQIVFEVHGTAREWVPATLERLLLPGVQVYLWWIGDIPDHDTLYDRLADMAHMIVFNSDDVDLRDLVKLNDLAQRASGHYVLADLAWVRLRWWQELLARFFDDTAVRRCLSQAHKLTLRCALQGNSTSAGGEPVSTAAGLYAGWFATRIGADTTRALWTKTGSNARQVVMPGSGGDLTVCFEGIPRTDILPGALLRVGLETRDGSRFEVARSEENPRVLGWLGQCKGAVIPHTVLKIGLPDEANLLARKLASPLRDALFETSLSATAQMISTLNEALVHGENGA